MQRLLRVEAQHLALPRPFNRNEMGYSPDRVALVWALTELMIEGGKRRLLIA